MYQINVSLRPFQRRFVEAATKSGIDTAILSMPRGNGKSWLAAVLLARGLTPGDPLHVPGSEYLLCAASIEQARLCFRFVREWLEPTGEYRFLDSATRIGITHKKTNTRLRVLSSNGKTSMGIVNCPLLVADEPGSWEIGGGQLMSDAIFTAQGKPGSALRVIMIGTLAPMALGSGHWYFDLVADGSHGSTFVQSLRGDLDKWDSWPEIRRCNPLTAISPEFRAKLLEERDAARADSRLKARFLSYRLNLPSGDESTMLLSVSDWECVTARQVSERVGRPAVGVDLGAGRAWSAGVAIWKSGRVEAMAVAPGIPSLADQEKRDRQPTGTYQRLYDLGLLRVADGLRVPPPQMLIDAIKQEWGTPGVIVADRFRESELRDVTGGIPLETRVTRWSEAASDIRGLRKIARDGPMSITPESEQLVAASLAVAWIRNDDAGSSRLVKRGHNNCSRDDVAAALLLSAGVYHRAESKPAKRSMYHGTV